jgi:hypothetical protein
LLTLINVYISENFFFNFRPLCLYPYNEISGDNFYEAILNIGYCRHLISSLKDCCMYWQMQSCRVTFLVSPEGMQIGIVLHIIDPALEGVQWSSPRPDCCGPHKEFQQPFYRRLCGPPVRSEWVWENLALTGIRTPDFPTRGQSLYRLWYPCRHIIVIWYALHIPT